MARAQLDPSQTVSHSTSMVDRFSPSHIGARRPGAQAGSGLLIIDDWFPNLLSGFRVAEFVHHLRVFPGLQVIATTPDPSHFARFAERYREVSDRVLPWRSDRLDAMRAAWFVFLNNAHTWLAEMEKRSIPFVFTLYPGGGFNLGDPESEAKLVRVLASPMLSAVIATQPITVETLRRMGCPVPVHDIPGVVVNPIYVVGSRARITFVEPGVTRICFAAFRYDPGGRSKGFPEFLGAAAILARDHPKLRFAVAGDLGPADWPVPAILEGRIAFHGPMPTSELQDFFLGQDVIVSPSRRHATSGTMFDGFPTGSCVEAALCGAAVLSSDELDQNRFYRVNEEILVCSPEAEAIALTLKPIVHDPARLAAIAEAGRQRTVTLYGAAAQLLPRTRVLRSLAAEAGIPGGDFLSLDTAGCWTPLGIGRTRNV
jgi:lipopolysaccharide transport system ATP-binding protein